MQCYESVAHCYETLQNVTEHYRAFRDVTERYGSIMELLWNVVENIDFAHH